MELLTPDFGLFFWQLFVFLILFFLLAKFAWRPILDSLKVREESIEEALQSAESAREEMTKLQSSNQQLLDEARQERDQILKDATSAANKLVESAKDDASKEGKRMIEEARQAIQIEKQAAIADVKNQVAVLSLEISEKLLRKNLSDDNAQKALVAEFLSESKIN